MTRKLDAWLRTPNIKFLEKVRDRQVFKAVSRRRHGCVWRFVGGEKTAQAHAYAGFIKMPYLPDFGRPSFAELTAAGEAVLKTEQDKA